MMMAYHDGQPFNENMLRPCPMLENPEKLRKMVAGTDAHSTDLQSPETVEHRVQNVINMQSIGNLLQMSCGSKAVKEKQENN